MRPPASIAFLAPFALSCSSSPSGTLLLVTGAETDTFTRSPAPTTLVVDAVDPTTGASVSLAKVSLPTSSIDLGNHDENDVAILTVSGLDATGNQLVYGATIPLEYGYLEGQTPIFVQRTGEWARLPNPLSDSRQAPLLASINGQYLFVAGGSDSTLATTTQIYDFLALNPLPSPPSMLPVAPESIAFVGTVALLVGTQSAYYFDFSQNEGSQTPIAPPSSAHAFADVAGGQAIVDDNGIEYIVGATRTTGAPTAAVLVINPNDTSVSAYVTGNLTWASLAAPRLGAAASWISGRGLVVAGGNPTAPGVEVLASTSQTGAALAYPPDGTVGAGAVSFPTTQNGTTQNLLLLAGGLGTTGQDAGIRTVDLSCAATCSPAPVAPLPVAVSAAQVFTWGSAPSVSTVVVGSDPTGATHVFRLPTWTPGMQAPAVSELPTKVPHTNARAVVTPVGTLALFGGGMGEIESYTP